MKVGCFALIDPFSTLDHQLERIAGMGFKFADVTDSHPGSSLGRDYGFAATASLDGNPKDLKRLFEKHGLTATTVCAHATLLDPVSPSRFGTHEINKAINHNIPSSFSNQSLLISSLEAIELLFLLGNRVYVIIGFPHKAVEFENIFFYIGGEEETTVIIGLTTILEDSFMYRIQVKRVLLYVVWLWSWLEPGC